MKSISFEALTGRTQAHVIQVDEKKSDVLLHPTVRTDFFLWQNSATKQGFDLAIASGYRSYERQLLIWNEKIAGKRPLYDQQGKCIDPKTLDEPTLLQTILYWSHIPGCSRHHWGTDMDVFDQTWYQAHHQRLQLINAEYEPGGPNAEFHQWMETKTLAQKNFAFFRPYGAPSRDNLSPSINQELWHYSHKKISKTFQQLYSLDIFMRNLWEAPELLLRDLLLKNANFYYCKYLQL